MCTDRILSTMRLHKRVLHKYREEGTISLIRAILRNSTVPLLQLLFDTSKRRIAMQNGVPVRNVSLLASKDVFPHHEEQLFQSIRDYVPAGAMVVLIGGGSGASTVCAARQVGVDGYVEVYEASESMARVVRETIELNGVSDVASCHHAVVETPIHVLGNVNGAEVLSGNELPSCDVLVMDCEGAELDILQSLDSYPSIIIVETHSHFGASSKDVREIIPKELTEIECLNRSENIDILVFKKSHVRK